MAGGWFFYLDRTGLGRNRRSSGAISSLRGLQRSEPRLLFSLIELGDHVLDGLHLSSGSIQVDGVEATDGVNHKDKWA